MSFFDYQRLDDIVNLLLNKKEAVHINELSSYCSVSDRTIRSDINTINDYIKDHGAHVILIRKKGYVIEYFDKKAFDEFWSHQDTGTFLFTTSEARLTFLIRLFLTSEEFISHNYLQSVLFVSQNTLYSDLRALRQSLTGYNLKIQNKSNLGYKVLGQEQDFRSAIIDLIFKNNFTEYLTASTSAEKDVCSNINYDQFNKIYEEQLSKEIFIDSDYFQRNIFTSLLLTVSRVKAGHTLSKFEQSIRLSQHFKPVINQFIKIIEKQFDLKLSAIERSYINFCIAENSPHLIDDSAINENQELAENILELIHNTLQKLTDSNWIDDLTLENNLLEHIKLFLKIQTIKGNRNNPLLNTVKNNFPYAFDLAIGCSREIVKRYNIHFTEDEISYIALHFANAIERNSAENHKQVSLAIICGTGQTLSSIIEAKIKRRFPNTFSSIEKLSYTTFLTYDKSSNRFDLIVSTIPIRENSSKIVFIDINDLDASMTQIGNKINELVVHSINTPEGLLSAKYFHVIHEKSTKEDVLSYLHTELLSQGYVKENFLTEIYERESISSTIISDSVALPHPLGDAVITSTIFPVIAPKGITWDSKLIKFVFLFAIKAEEPEKMEFIYERLLDFITSEKLQAKLLKEPTFDSLLSILVKNKHQ
ncbi:BglG family transcription antiterminator [Streptococcus tangpeifui]|uniref:BglG family transcription antiterminator n=1 Tax=Streptococcus tangpeifui TaxID=2709400 RepID=UPI0013ECBF68|nr:MULTISPECIES: BglG family transcription antiterminator [unclassified Streptococcus]